MSNTQVFDSERLAEILIADFGFKDNFEVYVAYSGGLDSTALLHALVRIKDVNQEQVTALHVNHHLHENSSLWEAECRQRCQAWGVRFLSHQLDVSSVAKLGVEGAAREARYNWFSQHLDENGVLITAHHLNDQVETILANLFRGSGVHGLKGIARKRKLGRGQLWRPVLKIKQSAMHDYAAAHQLQWIEDPANKDPRYTRNIIRHKIVPLIKETWPGVEHTISRGAENWQDAALLLDALAEQDLETCAQYRRSTFFALSVPDLHALSGLRCRNVLLFWFKKCGFEPPSRRHLNTLYESMLRNKPTATAVLTWAGVEIRRYREWLYLSPPMVRNPIPQVAWDKTASIPGVLINGRQLSAIATTGRGIKKEVYDQHALTIRGRLGGERCWLPGHAQHHKLKKLFQKRGIPPWERDQIPLVYVGDELAAVVGLWYCQPFAAEEGEPGMEFRLADL